MKIFVRLVALVLLLMLSGCMGTAGTMTLFDTAGNVIAEVSDAAVQRDIVYNVTHRNRDNVYGKLYKNSGIVVKWKDVKLSDGSMAWLPEEMSIREQPRFQQNLETRPPDHRGWDTADKFGELLLKGFGIWSLAEFGKSAMSSATPKYNGPYQSYNPQTTTYATP